VSWLDPQKTRKMVVVGSRKMAVYDDTAEDKLAIFDKGIDRKAVLGENMDYDRPGPVQFTHRSGDVVVPKLNFVEPLRAEAEHFVDCLRGGHEAFTGIAHARQVVSILERAGR
jgi:predicted dehydrogenase